LKSRKQMTDQTPEPCDILIEAGFFIPVEPHGVILEDHAVAVRDGALVAILPCAAALARFAAAQTVRRPDGTLVPGSLYCHTHPHLPHPPADTVTTGRGET